MAKMFEGSSTYQYIQTANIGLLSKNISYEKCLIFLK